MDLCRELQKRYRMEPAGSQGVWSLDDYQFVAFIWGAAQMTKAAKVSPKAIPDPEMAQVKKKQNFPKVKVIFLNIAIEFYLKFGKQI